MTTEKKSPYQLNPRKGTRGTPAEAKSLVAAYAKSHDMTHAEAEAFLIYVGFNRRAAIERQERAKPKKKAA